MKKTLLILTILVLFFSKKSVANHITGGQIYYTLVGQSGGNYTYSVSLLLYRDSASSGAQLDPAAPIAIFDKSTGQMVWNSTVPKSETVVLHLWSPGPCINNPP